MLALDFSRQIVAAPRASMSLEVAQRLNLRDYLEAYNDYVEDALSAYYDSLRDEFTEDRFDEQLKDNCREAEFTDWIEYNEATRKEILSDVARFVDRLYKNDTGIEMVKAAANFEVASCESLGHAMTGLIQNWRKSNYPEQESDTPSQSI